MSCQSRISLIIQRVGWVCLTLSCAVLLAQAAIGAESVPPAATPAASDASALPPAVLLAPGQLRSIPVSEVERIAIGNPDVVDVTIVSPRELLVQAKKVGSTNLIVWDAQGQRDTTISVVDPRADAISKELTELVKRLNLPVEIEVHSGKVFLTGQVAGGDALNVLSEAASSFGDLVVNLVTATPAPPPPEAPQVLVKLSVQVLEVNRKDLERLGVKWSESIGISEPEATDLTFEDALRKWGTSLTRSSVSASLNALIQKNKARLLAEPKLVTASGKEASSFIGVEVPVIRATSIGRDSTSVNASIGFRQTGVVLKMTPTVSPAEQDRTIRTVIEAEVSAIDVGSGLTIPVGSRAVLVPGFTSRKVNTEVTTAPGETIVIAGLLQAEDSNAMSQVPALGSMPVLGRLFRSPEVSSTQRELVIAVTPDLLLDAAAEADRGLVLEQALAVAEVTGSVDDPRLRYALQVQDRIAKAVRYPQRERELNIAGTVKLRLHLFADGTLGRAMVSESSGIEALDSEALKAAESQAPYSGFPSQLTERELWLELPVIFRPS